MFSQFVSVYYTNTSNVIKNAATMRSGKPESGHEFHTGIITGVFRCNFYIYIYKLIFICTTTNLFSLLSWFFGIYYMHGFLFTHKTYFTFLYQIYLHVIIPSQHHCLFSHAGHLGLFARVYNHSFSRDHIISMMFTWIFWTCLDNVKMHMWCHMFLLGVKYNFQGITHTLLLKTHKGLKRLHVFST